MEACLLDSSWPFNIVCPSNAAMQHLLFCSLLLFLSCCMRNAVQVYGAGAARAGFHTITVSSLLPKDKCSGGGFRGLPITPRYGPCSKTGRPQPPSPQEISGHESSFSLLESKVNQHGWIKQAFGGDADFLVEVRFGTPPQNLRLLLDTGSSFTWTQCSPCVKCLSGASSFNQAASATYSSGSCINPTGEDNYSIVYGDYSSSAGHYGCDTLKLDPPDVFPKFQFGCGMENRGDFGEGVDGVLGLGRGPNSFLSQTASKYKNVFSYCLPDEYSTGSLLFGDEAMSQSSSLNFTPLLNPGSSGYYRVELSGISVAYNQVTVTISSEFPNPVTIIDSGTVISRLPSKAYSALKAAFKVAMGNYNLSDTKPVEGDILDTCFDLSRNAEVEIPEMVLHFGGGTDVVLNAKSIFWGDNKSNLCLAFAESTSQDSALTIIGNRQLLRTVLYDIPGGRIGFGSVDCAESLINTNTHHQTGSSCIIEII